MGSLWRRTNRWLTWFHRWAGVVLCLFFAMWFASGAVLHFVGFPALPADEQRGAGEVIDVSQVRLDPGAALDRLPGATDLRLIEVAGRPRYVALDSRGAWTAVAADTGEELPPLSATDARAVAESFGRTPVLRVSEPMLYDQWIVHQRLDAYRPLYRVRLNDAAATDLYVSSRSGEVVQRTRFAGRAWNWAGAVIHWIYFTPLRKSWSAWNQVVWWISLAALASSAAGTWLGVVRMAANRRLGRRGWSPFRGWMRWHHVIGLFASVCVVGWILSGWLSMDHGRLFSRGEASSLQAEQLRGMSWPALARAATRQSLERVSPAVSIGFHAVAGRPFVTAEGPLARPARVLLLDAAGATPQSLLPDDLLTAGVRNVWPDASPAPQGNGDDALYRRAESTGEAAAVFTVPDDPRLRVYVERASGCFVAVMDRSRRIYAWFYYALHTLQFPALIAHPGLRTALVLGLLTLGFVFSITGVILSVERLKRDLAT